MKSGFIHHWHCNLFLQATQGGVVLRRISKSVVRLGGSRLFLLTESNRTDFDQLCDPSSPQADNDVSSNPKLLHKQRETIKNKMWNVIACCIFCGFTVKYQTKQLPSLSPPVAINIPMHPNPTANAFIKKFYGTLQTDSEPLIFSGKAKINMFRSLFKMEHYSVTEAINLQS